MKNIANGDYFTIPCEDKTGLMKVIFCSQYFKDVILIKLFRKLYDGVGDLGSNTSSYPFDLYYTGSDQIRNGKWKRVASGEVDATEVDLSRRIVAGDVWIDDKRIGVATEIDLAQVPKMRTFGTRLIEKAVSRL